ncbi:MAG: hypothetical protein ACRC6B_03225 [Fusobacteriaceae bacterium]
MKITAYKPDINQEYENGFKHVYPYSGIGRVVTDKDTGEILAELSENDSNLTKEGNYWAFDSFKHDIMVKFPKFYYKREWVGEVLKDSILSEIPYSATTANGYEIFPVFLREDGSIRDYVLYGAFKGVELNGQLRSIFSTGALVTRDEEITATSLELLTKEVGYKPTASKTIASFRSLARQGRNTNFNIETYGMISMIQLLYKVAFQDLHSQSVLGNGWTGKSESAVTGSTMSLGNRSGYLGVNGNQISLFGIEDFYGSIWSFVDGMLVTDAGYHVTNNPLNFGDIAKHDLIPCSPLAGVSANAYVEGFGKTIEKVSGKYKYMNMFNSIGATESSNYSDYIWSHRATQTNICLFGSEWNDGSRSGAFCLYLDAVASAADANVGARLVCLG